MTGNLALGRGLTPFCPTYALSDRFVYSSVLFSLNSL